MTSANSIYGNTAIGVYVLGGVTYSYIVNVPGILQSRSPTPAALTVTAANTAAIASAGDDVVNSGTILATGTGWHRRQQRTYGVVTNSGTIGATGTGGIGVRMTGSFGSLLNYGTINAAPGAVAIRPTRTAVGTPSCSTPA